METVSSWRTPQASLDTQPPAQSWGLQVDRSSASAQGPALGVNDASGGETCGRAANGSHICVMDHEPAWDGAAPGLAGALLSPPQTGVSPGWQQPDFSTVPGIWKRKQNNKRAIAKPERGPSVSEEPLSGCPTRRQGRGSVQGSCLHPSTLHGTVWSVWWQPQETLRHSSWDRASQAWHSSQEGVLAGSPKGVVGPGLASSMSS